MKIFSVILVSLSICIATPTQAQRISNGRYAGVRGYNAPSFPYCLPRYNFVADVSNGVITFESDDRIWSGDIDQRTGQIFIPYSGVTPPPKQNVYIRGAWTAATMVSAYCGSGYFTLFNP